MTRIWEGKPSGAGLRFGLVLSRFNSTVTEKLLEGALEALAKSKVDADDIEVVRVPGAFEIPLAAKRLAESRRFAAVVCLGAIIKGGTPHWDYLSRSVTDGVLRASFETGVPMTNAVLTTETFEQAVARSRGKGNDNKGYDAALAAVEVAVLHQMLAGDAKGRS